MACKTREMAYIVLPIVAWKRLLETGLDDLWTHLHQLSPCRGDLHPARADLHPAHADLHPARTENQPELTSGALFHGYFHVLRRVQ